MFLFNQRLSLVNLPLRRIRLASALALAAGCTGEAACLVLPCPESVAVTLTVTSAQPAVLLGDVVVQSSTSATPPQCTKSGASASCTVRGMQGVYSLVIGALGFASQQRSVSVSRSGDGCGCSFLATQHLDVALVPSS